MRQSGVVRRRVELSKMTCYRRWKIASLLSSIYYLIFDRVYSRKEEEEKRGEKKETRLVTDGDKKTWVRRYSADVAFDTGRGVGY